MVQKATIIKIDINGFINAVQSDSPQDMADFLNNYYQSVWERANRLNWRFIKSIGDCVLLLAETNDSAENIEQFFEDVSNNYDVTLHYRECRFAEKEFKISSYSCVDVFGKDINKLFMNDPATKQLG
ncbi:adenylate/guanylate cyclase domain-containing protein [Desulfococcaceae bacterium HSG9]|nr:adenylate/guanylate cyclase domain-containing protein [Desulfococcaceae bacterium HSG9]